jgi:hypothetical protein
MDKKIAVKTFWFEVIFHKMSDYLVLEDTRLSLKLPYKSIILEHIAQTVFTYWPDDIPCQTYEEIQSDLARDFHDDLGLLESKGRGVFVVSVTNRGYCEISIQK